MTAEQWAGPYPNQRMRAMLSKYLRDEVLAQAARVQALEQDRDSWRRVCERLEREKQALEQEFQAQGRMLVDAVKRGDKLEQERERVRQGLAKTGYSPWELVTAGANPQKDGTMSPPLWHGECKWCHVKAPTKPQWKYPAHPENDCVWILLASLTPAGEREET